MILNRQILKTLLEQLDCSKAARNSTINHHVDGMDYLCLHRSDEVTVKLYLVEDPQNPNAGFLVNPHSHRYSFSSRVFKGEVEHLRFTETPENMCSALYEEHVYTPATKALKQDNPYRALMPSTIEKHTAGSSYFVKDNEINTLRMVPGTGPFLLGLVQFRDTRMYSELYTHIGHEIVYPNSRQPTVEETEALRKRCLELITL